MHAGKNKNSIILSSRNSVIEVLLTLLRDVDKQFPAGASGFSLGETAAHYGTEIAKMEGLSRVLWGLFPLMSSGAEVPFSEKYIEAIKQGTDPQHAGFWGYSGPYDQRLVEMGVYGVGLALLQEKLTDKFSQRQQQNIFNWLNQISAAEMPDSNWNYFAIMVQLGFRRAGFPWDKHVIERRFAQMEAYYLGHGWYSDGAGRPKDYYISMAFHFYGLIYATLSDSEDAERATILRERAKAFATDFIYMSAADGASVPFGRSLTYRFAMIAFWCAVAFSGVDILPPGELKGLILRHLRWWLRQPIFDRDGILTLGYAYPNLAMCEDYNSPGSPYWALKVFLILALAEDHPFWLAEEKPLSLPDKKRVIPQASQIIVHSDDSKHVYMLTSGQLELNNYVNTEAKYTRFAYSSLFGFTIERGRFGIKHAAADSALLLCENDDYYRGRRECSEVIVAEDYIFSRWSPWHDVHIASWLIPCGEWHIRAHLIDSKRELKSVEGGFALINAPEVAKIIGQGKGCLINASNGASVIYDLPVGQQRSAGSVITPPNSSIMFAECAIIPVLNGRITTGKQWLCCAVAATGKTAEVYQDKPQLLLTENMITVISADSKKKTTILI
ncbi:DUF2264 domain-containing protein [Pantoea sp. B65]|uniref:DUF2264 domain-containing protein n=1 Tax=Pantoea sp. B65 TaxID=2813359 RepID=UPI0039B66EF0